jgi:hypothetical protein
MAKKVTVKELTQYLKSRTRQVDVKLTFMYWITDSPKKGEKKHSVYRMFVDDVEVKTKEPGGGIYLVALAKALRSAGKKVRRVGPLAKKSKI